MAETENGQVQAPPDKQAALLQELLAEVRGLRATVAIWHEEFQRYSPVLDAYLRPDAGGPLGWAVRRAQEKRAKHGQD